MLQSMGSQSLEMTERLNRTEHSLFTIVRVNSQSKKGVDLLWECLLGEEE